MVEYLPEHGVNPKVRLFEKTSEYSTEYWLLKEMDVQIMNDASQDEAAADVASCVLCILAEKSCQCFKCLICCWKKNC